MLKTLIALLLVNLTVARLQKEEILQVDEGYVVTTSGALRGTFIKFYNAYLGIPYAQPPIGNLRFRAPLPHPGWEGIRDANEFGNSCPTSTPTDGIQYSEDCLFMNIYKKKNSDPSQLMPVMVFFNGGRFPGLPVPDFTYEFDDLLEEKVIVVTLNYRLEALGFLSTGDNSAPGNYGLKDAVLALKWIRENIGAFGGDRNRTTIFGQGMGGAHVHYLVLSPAAKGLFNGAISQSGTALNPWAYDPIPGKQAYSYAKRLNIQHYANVDLMKKLRKINDTALINAIPGFWDYPIPRGHQALPFVPSRDPRGVSSEEMFLPDDPLQLIQSGSFNQVPYMVGFNDAECLFTIQELLIDPSIFRAINNNPNLLLPKVWKSPTAREIQTFYFNGTSNLNSYSRYGYTQYNTDVLFARGIDQTARFHGRIQPLNIPVYYYKFNFVGTLNIMKSILEVENYPGAVHGDELFYLFNVADQVPQFQCELDEVNPSTLSAMSKSLDVKKLMVRMWTNFAKYGNPTPAMDPITSIAWIRVLPEKLQYLSIGEKVVADENPFGDRMKFWNKYQE